MYPGPLTSGKGSFIKILFKNNLLQKSSALLDEEDDIGIFFC